MPPCSFFFIIVIYKPTRNKTCFPFFPFFFLFVSLVLSDENSDSLATEEDVSPHAFLLGFLSRLSNSARLDGPAAEDGRAGKSCCRSLLEFVRGVELPLHGVLD